MRKFLYKAKNEKGQIVTGTVSAANDFEADKILSKNKLYAMEIKAETLWKGRQSSQKFPMKEKALFARQLATMISAGLTLPKSVSIVARQAKNDNVRSVYNQIYRDLEEGYSFSSALSKHPNAFDKVFVAVVKSGETTGNLQTVLEQMANRLESDEDFSSKIKGALYYPVFILVALVGVAAYMMVAVIPQLKSLFDQQGAQLPWATRMLIATSDFIVNRWYVVIVVIIILIFLLRSWLASDAGSYTINRWQISIPLIKNLSISLYMARFSRTMEMLVGAGVPLVDSLKIVGTTFKNRVYEDSVARMVVEVEKGVPLSSPLNKDKNYPSLVGQMVEVGEETGKLDQVLAKVAQYYEDETNQRVKNISTLIEPAVLVIVGFGVAFLVFAILMPIYGVAQLQ